MTSWVVLLTPTRLQWCHELQAPQVNPRLLSALACWHFGQISFLGPFTELAIEEKIFCLRVSSRIGNLIFFRWSFCEISVLTEDELPVGKNGPYIWLPQILQLCQLVHLEAMLWMLVLQWMSTYKLNEAIDLNFSGEYSTAGCYQRIQLLLL